MNGVYFIKARAFDSNSNLQETIYDLIIELPNYNGNTIPANPGRDGYMTLNGIDLDKDGIRDDVELKINSLNIPNDSYNVFLDIAKIYQSYFTTDVSRTDAKKRILNELNLTYCLFSKGNQDQVDQNIRNLKAFTFNTRDRYYNWLYNESKLNGVKIEIETIEEEYAKYCN